MSDLKANFERLILTPSGILTVTHDVFANLYALFNTLLVYSHILTNVETIIGSSKKLRTYVTLMTAVNIEKPTLGSSIYFSRLPSTNIHCR